MIVLQAEHPGDDEMLVNLAVSALEMLGSITSVAAPGEESEAELGRPLSKGEQPHPQACVLYILRVGVIDRLGESGQVSMPVLDQSQALSDQNPDHQENDIF